MCEFKCLVANPTGSATECRHHQSCRASDPSSAICYSGERQPCCPVCSAFQSASTNARTGCVSDFCGNSAAFGKYLRHNALGGYAARRSEKCSFGRRCGIFARKLCPCTCGLSSRQCANAGAGRKRRTALPNSTTGGCYWTQQLQPHRSQRRFS